MKAQVYVVNVCGCWKARVTIKSAVDKHFWMSGEFGEAGCLHKEIADEGWLIKEELPLGDACVAVELWDRAMNRGKGGRAGKDKIVSGAGGNHSSYEALKLLLACAEEARAMGMGSREAEAGGLASREQKFDGAAKHVDKSRKLVGESRWWRWGKREKQYGTVGVESVLGLVERWKRVLGVEQEFVGVSGAGCEGGEAGRAGEGCKNDRTERVGELRGFRETEPKETMVGCGGAGREDEQWRLSGVKGERSLREHRDELRVDDVRLRRGIGRVRELRELTGAERVGELLEHREGARGRVMIVGGEGARVYSAAELGEIAAGAKLAAGMMQGRALLRSEAHALLDGASCPGAASSWREVLQLAALLGQVRLSGSIAAVGGGDWTLWGAAGRGAAVCAAGAARRKCTARHVQRAGGNAPIAWRALGWGEAGNVSCLLQGSAWGCVWQRRA
jgi:hypothetical protein